MGKYKRKSHYCRTIFTLNPPLCGKRQGRGQNLNHSGFKVHKHALLLVNEAKLAILANMLGIAANNFRNDLLFPYFT